MSDQEIAVKVDNVSKVFKLPHEKTTSVKSAVINFYKRRSFENQKVLTDISFEIKQGEFFGIVGRNGSGKSTLLKLLAGIYTPNHGGIRINGSLTPFIELGVGFNQELTGRENVFLNGALLGFSRKQMETMYDDIVDFAELERFMDQKIKNYSSGMQVRLAFSIAIRADSDILLLDEVLAVGDAIFQQKCFNYFKELKKNKKTVILVSHDSNALQEYCDRGILIEKGEIKAEGDITKVVNEYIHIINREEAKLRDQAAGVESVTKDRWGTRDMEILATSISNRPAKGSKVVFTDEDKKLYVTVKYKANKDCESPVYGITIVDGAGSRVFTSNTKWSKVTTKDIKKGQATETTWEIPNGLLTGDYVISPAVASDDGHTTYDWREGLTKFKVRKTLQSSGLINIDHKITISNS